MAAERDLELLDDYLTNRLSADEKVAFERKLTSDPELQAEFNMQQSLIGGIQKARVAELKAMMNNVPVPAVQGAGSVVATKVAMWVAVIGVVGVGAWFLLKDKPETTEVENSKTEQSTPEVATENDTNTAEQPSEDPTKPHEDSPVVSDEKASSEQKPVDVPKPIRKKKPAETPAEPKIEVYDPTEESENEPPPLIFDDNPKLNNGSEIAVEVDSQNKKYNFHYQFRGGKLFLFGPFQKDLYEIMEFFSDDTRTVFLYYGNQYYLLKDNNEKLKDLAPIQNEELIKKLNEYRKN